MMVEDRLQVQHSSQVQLRRRQRRQATLNAFLVSKPFDPASNNPAFSVPGDASDRPSNHVSEPPTEPSRACPNAPFQNLLTKESSAFTLDTPPFSYVNVAPCPAPLTFAFPCNLSIAPAFTKSPVCHSPQTDVPSLVSLPSGTQCRECPTKVFPHDSSPPLAVPDSAAVAEPSTSAMSDDGDTPAVMSTLTTATLSSSRSDKKSLHVNPPSRKRSRRSAAPTPTAPSSRPRTRAFLRASTVSPPPSPKVVSAPLVESLGTPLKPVATEMHTFFKRARKGFQQSAVSSFQNPESDGCTATLNTAKCHVPSLKRSGVRARKDSFDTDSCQMLAKAVETTPKQTNVIKASQSSESTPQGKRAMHPFFAASAVVSSIRDCRKFATLVHEQVSDAWSCPNATVHVNLVPPLKKSVPSLSDSKQRSPPTPFPSENALVSSACVRPKFCHFVSKRDTTYDLRSKQRPLLKEKADESGLWAERYKSDVRLDSINASLAAELFDWLRCWYDQRTFRDCASSDSDSSLLSEADRLNFCSGRESVAVITGPVGCGKTTLVGTVAKRLGLSVLEINSSVCRNRRLVRDFIGEALTSHRVDGGLKKLASSSVSPSRSSSPNTDGSCGNMLSSKRVVLANTLIVFEEVDEVQADEKGFWTNILELASSTGSRRPIVCTANSFTTTMRQFFTEKRGTVRADLDRLMVNTMEEQLPNTVTFKHLSFPDMRSERQTLSVLQRVALTESIEEHQPLCDTLSVLHRYDTRRAINQLQLWGIRDTAISKEMTHACEGTKLTVTQSQSRQDWADTVQCGVEFPVIPSVLFVETTLRRTNGSVNSQSSSLEGHVNSDWLPDLEGDLDLIATSLEAISEYDVLENACLRQVKLRNANARLPTEAVNLDSDLLRCGQMMEDTILQALKVQRSGVLSQKSTNHTRDVAVHVNSVQRNSTAVFPMMSMFPRARRPIVVDIVPMLISMVRAEDERVRTGREGVGVAPVAPICRTRLRSRQCGINALDLDAATTLVLRKASIAPKQYKRVEWSS